MQRSIHLLAVLASTSLLSACGDANTPVEHRRFVSMRVRPARTGSEQVSLNGCQLACSWPREL